MGVIAVTGSASGIGAAIRARLRRDGAEVIGVDLREAEVVADLSTRRDAARRSRGSNAPRRRLDGVVVCAGVGPHVTDHPAIVSVNYFGAQALRRAVAGAAAAGGVAISAIHHHPSARRRGVAAGRSLPRRRRGRSPRAGGDAARADGLRRLEARADALAAPRRAQPGMGGRGDPPERRRRRTGADPAAGRPRRSASPDRRSRFRSARCTPTTSAAAVAFLLGPKPALRCGSLFVRTDGGSAGYRY